MGKVVAIGGGHGLAAVLLSLQTIDCEVSAIVSVADDGGSSGPLRDQYGIPAPGDVRRCISALADPDNMLGQTLETRFSGGDLDGHPIGNLILTALTQKLGSFSKAIDELCARVGAVGRILPASQTAATLLAETAEGQIFGQVAIERAITQGRHVTSIDFTNEAITAPESAIKELATADLILLGPGSLLTSVVAAAIVPNLREAINSSSAECLFIANISSTRPHGEISNTQYQLKKLTSHQIDVDRVLIASELNEPLMDESWTAAPILAYNGMRHDPTKLGAAIASFLP